MKNDNTAYKTLEKRNLELEKALILQNKESLKRITELQKLVEFLSRKDHALSELIINRDIVSGNLQGAKRVLTESACYTLGVERASIWLITENRKELHCIECFESSSKQHLEGEVLKLEDYRDYFSAINKQSLTVIDDTLVDSVTGDFYTEYLISMGITSTIDATISGEKGPLGVFCFQHTGKQRKWSADEKSFSMALASMIYRVITISERKESEAALRESEERNLALLKANPDLMFMFDKNGVFVDFYSGVNVPLFVSPDIFLGKNISEVMPPYIVELTLHHLTKLFQTGLMQLYNYQIQENNEIKEFETRLVLSGKAKALALVSDITERHQSKKALKISEHNYTTIFNNVPEAIFIHDTITGKIVDVNDQMLKMYGYSYKEEIFAITIMDLSAQIDTHIKETVKDQIRKTINEGPQNFEWLAKKKDGTIFWIEMTLKKTDIGGEGRILAVGRNITDRKYAELLFKEKNERIEAQNKEYQKINDKLIEVNLELTKAKGKAEEIEEKLLTYINSIPDVVSYKDGDGRWLLANNACLECFCLTGVDYFQKTDKELIEIVNEKYKNTITDCIITDENAWNSGEASHYTEVVPIGNGKNQVFDIVKIPIFNPDGKRKSLAMIGRDITLLYETQNDLILAKEKAEESDHLKSAFLANMSHEIRTPMNGILGFAELLKEPDLTGEERHNYVSIIEKSGLRLLNIINDLIDISKIESGQTEVIISTYNVNEQIEYIYTFFKPEVERKGMQLFLQNSMLHIETLINSDREKVYAILTNLVKNAIKYSDKGTIELGYTLKESSITAKQGNGQETTELTSGDLEFFVKDTGIGIPINKTEAIFDRFVQGDIADIRAFQGAGLGLSISKAYVEMLGGKIWVESEVGRGSTFYFTLPSLAVK